MAQVPSITLSDGNKIPQLGLGVWQVDPAITARVVADCDQEFVLLTEPTRQQVGVDFNGLFQHGSKGFEALGVASTELHQSRVAERLGQCRSSAQCFFLR